MEQSRFELAHELVKKCGKLLLSKVGENLDRHTKTSPVDFVTEADIVSQKTITDTLAKCFPTDSVIAEEEYTQKGGTGWTWIIDPLDGTNNFAHSFPIYCVSIGIYKDGIGQAGFIYCPTLDELFEGRKGEGVKLNGRPVHVSDKNELITSLLATGFPYDKASSVNNNVDNFVYFLKKSHAIRRLGSAALDLAYVACGRIDGFWELKLQPWDVAAGAFLVIEAGGMVTGFKGEPYDIYNRYIVATNGLIHDKMIEVLQRK